MAMGWLIYRLTDSELMLGMIWFAMRGRHSCFRPLPVPWLIGWMPAG